MESLNRVVTDSGNVRCVAIVETLVLGIRGYYARCMDSQCTWESRRFDTETSAVRSAHQHSCKIEEVTQ